MQPSNGHEGSKQHYELETKFISTKRLSAYISTFFDNGK